MEGFTAEQIDFESSREDRSAARSAGLLRERNRRESAIKKSFKLRGLKGKEKKGFRQKSIYSDLKPSAVERLERKMKAARKARVAAGTEGTSHAVRQFAQSEGFLKEVKAPQLPWRNKKKGKSKKVESEKQAFDLFAAVAKFKRSGVLPSVTLEVVKTASVEGVDGSSLKRMIRAMLLKSGIEPNPGPDLDKSGSLACKNSGRRVKGEMFKAPNGKKFYTCLLCAAHLTDLEFFPKKSASGDSVPRSVWGRHPKADSSGAPVESTSIQPPLPVEVLETPVKSSLEFKPVFAPNTPNTTPLPNSPPTNPALGHDCAHCQKCQVLGYPCNAPPPVPIDEVEAPPEFTLDGRVLNNEELFDMMEGKLGHDIDEQDIEVLTVAVPYVGERRLIACRNVIEVKQNFKAVQIKVVDINREQHWYTDIVADEWRRFAAFSISACFLLSTILSLFVFEISLQSEYGLPFIAAQLVSSIGIAVAASQIEEIHPDAVYVNYVPHLVSSTMIEYERGTDAVQALGTIRSKLRRLAAFPLPDDSCDALIEGTEEVVLYLLGRTQFFTRGAACFQLP